MTVEQFEQVRIDGKWHALENWNDGYLTTACGQTIRSNGAEISEEGDTPEGLSGTTICYDCSRAYEEGS